MMMMGDGELQEQGDDDIIINEIDFENLLESLPVPDDLDLDIFGGDDFPVLTESSCIEAPVQETPNSSPIFGFMSIEEVEQMLMKDDNKQVEEEESQELCQNFFSDFLGDVAAIDQSVVEPRVSNEDGSNPESNLSDDSQEKESDGGSEIQKDDDPICKKRKRQMRNRDAALRSRERKKLYVRDLEIKSGYLEGECRRLQQLLHCCVAENHNLHLQLQKNKAFGASMTKQESAVLFLESLLLGSLLWFLGIMCLFSLQGLVHQNHCRPAGVLLVVNVDRDSLEVVDLRAGNKRRIGLGMLRLFFKRKRCRATRSKMKKQCLYLVQSLMPALV